MRLTRPFLVRSLPSLLPLALFALLALGPATASAQSPELLRKLNAPAARVQEKSKSSQRLFTAYLDLTKAPKPFGEEFNQTTIWPGMDGWADVAKWAEANASIGKALIDVQDCAILGVPYGTAGSTPSSSSAG